MVDAGMSTVLVMCEINNRILYPLYGYNVE